MIAKITMARGIVDKVPACGLHFYLGEKLTWNYYVGFGLVLAAVFFVYHQW